MVGLKKTHLRTRSMKFYAQNEIKRLRRMRRMKLSALGNDGERHKIEPISAKFSTQTKHNLDPKATSQTA